MSEELQQRLTELEAENAELRTQVTGLAETARRLRFALDSIPLRVFWKDHESVYLGCNARFALDAGIENPAAIAGHTDMDFFPDHAARYREQDARLFRTGEAQSNYIDEFMTASGSRFMREVSKVPLRDTEGRIIGVLGMYTDVTQRSRDEQRLRESERLLAEAKRIAGLGRWVADARGQKTWWDDRMYEIFGLPQDTVIDNDVFFGAVHPDDLPGVMQRYEAVMQPNAGSSYNLDYRILRPDGSLGYVSSHGAVERDADGRIVRVVGVALDVTQQREAEAERLRLQQEIIHAQQEALKDLSTPIIPILDRMIIMPLIGTIDTSRARDIMRELLAGIGRYRARIVILDITGVPVVDSGVADHLDHTIQAARLKGATTIITGISDAVAETIVDLGIDWRHVETRRDLQSGLVFGLAQLGIDLSSHR